MRALEAGFMKRWVLPCRIPGCPTTFDSLPDLYKHEKGHFNQHGRFACLADRFNFITKRWRELRRHDLVRYCAKAQKFPCSVPWCKFAGDNNFARKDKLTSHFNNFHKGVKAAPRQGLQTIKRAQAGRWPPAPPLLTLRLGLRGQQASVSVWQLITAIRQQ